MELRLLELDMDEEDTLYVDEAGILDAWDLEDIDFDYDIIQLEEL
jgi:hypothetical protein